MPLPTLSRPALSLAALILAAAPLAADTPPPDGALPLSRILSLVEASDSIRWIDEVDWDDDGYWEVEYITAEGRKVEIRVDPLSGEIRRR